MQSALLEICFQALQLKVSISAPSEIGSNDQLRMYAKAEGATGCVGETTYTWSASITDCSTGIYMYR